MKNKIRVLPPIIVGGVIAAILFIASFDIIGQSQMRIAAAPCTEAVGGGVIEASLSENSLHGEGVTATAEPESTYESLIMSRDWSAEESRMLMKIAMAEAEGESTEGKALVMLVVLNRVWSDDFPNTIEAVIFQPKQFSPVMEGGRYWTTEPDEDCRRALELVLSGWDESGGALYFESCKGGSWHSENLELIREYGGHRFYK